MFAEVDWDEEKNLLNQRDHQGLTFEEAATVFDDQYGRIVPDDAHSFGERRYTLIGMSSAGRLLRVTYTERGRLLRIISARRADRRERKRYEQGT